MIDKELVQKKVVQIIGYADEIRPLAKGMTVEEVLADNYKMHAAERLLQLIVDAMLDINTHIIKECHLGAPDDLTSTFVLLAEKGVLDKSFANAISGIVGMRNRLVHQYDKVSRRLFIELLQQNYVQFDEYLKQINAFVEKQVEKQ